MCQLKAVLPKVGQSNKHRIERRNTIPRWVVASLPTLERPLAARESSKYARPSSLSSSSCYTGLNTDAIFLFLSFLENLFKNSLASVWQINDPLLSRTLYLLLNSSEVFFERLNDPCSTDRLIRAEPPEQQ